MSAAEKWEKQGAEKSDDRSGLARHYRIIGTELMRLEQRCASLNRDMAQAQRDFRVGVVLVSTEILEAFLDDLFDLRSNDSKLFIRRDGSKIREVWIPIGGLLASIACGLYASTFGISLLWSLLLSVVLALPFGLLLSMVPHGGAPRRMLFAQVVSHEILRRRGRQGNRVTNAFSDAQMVPWQKIALEGGSSKVIFFSS